MPTVACHLDTVMNRFRAQLQDLSPSRYNFRFLDFAITDPRQTNTIHDKA